MKKTTKTGIAFLFLLLTTLLPAQNEASKWYFGDHAGLDFMTNPPTVLNNSAMLADEGCSSVADAAGNLLFYTNGCVIWNKLHVPMANGTGLLGDLSATQSGMIIKQPGNTNLYYIFTLDASNTANGLRYSVVDMSLAATNGSVTVKNMLLFTPSTEKLTAARHCNGTDIWVISHDWNPSNFRCHLLSPSGISTTPVISTLGPVATATMNVLDAAIGCIKVSPDGKKIGLARRIDPASYELYDFDNTTGIVSNSLSLGTGFSYAYGCEFSPDCSKFYGTSLGGELYQWDLCAGSDSAIIASHYLLDATIGKGTLQTGPNGKIYVTRLGQYSLGVINNPNAAGAVCNYINNGQSIAPAMSIYGLPNLPLLKETALPFSYVNNGCSSYSFNIPSSVGSSSNLCSASVFSLMNVSWNFGDPASQSLNISFLNNPVHNFSSLGTYTVQLVLNYACGGGSQTISQVISTGAPGFLNVTGKSIICTGESTTLTASGASSYSWNTNALTSSIITTPVITTVYTVNATYTSAACPASRAFTVTVEKCTAINEVNLNTTLLTIYPNPANDHLFVKTEKTVRVLIHNYMGEIISEYFFLPGKHTVDISTYSNGIYSLKASDNLGSKTIKLVKTD